MRRLFADELYNQMTLNPNIILLVGDLGYKMFDKIRDDYPKQFINVGAAESSMLDIAVGLALSGKIVFCYTITSFFMRAAETIGLYLQGEQVPVKLVGSGRDQDYEQDGPSHDCTIAQNYLKSLFIEQFYPEVKVAIPGMVEKMIKSSRPSFISLKR